MSSLPRASAQSPPVEDASSRIAPGIYGTPGTSDADLAAALAECAAITRRRARNFYHGLRLTPEPRRSALYAVYAWMRAADDEADRPDSLAAKREHLAARREELRRLVNAESAPHDDPRSARVWLALRHVLDAYPVDPGDFAAMIDGLDEDLDHRGYATREELTRYCHRVASTVGAVCIDIWGLRPGVDREAARELAYRRGVAYQLTNILRDFAPDFDEGRVYIPRADLDRHRLDARDLRAWASADHCAALVRELAAWARSEYTASAPLDAMIDPACGPTLWAMTRIYSGLLRKIEQSPRRIVESRRIRLQSLHKAGIAAVAMIKARAFADAGAPALTR